MLADAYDGRPKGSWQFKQAGVGPTCGESASAEPAARSTMVTRVDFGVRALVGFMMGSSNKNK